MQDMHFYILQEHLVKSLHILLVNDVCEPTYQAKDRFHCSHKTQD